MFDEPDADMHFFPTYDRQSTENIVPVAVFVARKIAGLKKSFASSTDADERNEIIAAMVFHQSVLLLLCLSFFTESTELTDIAKEIFRK
jgi:hypothetical protein